MEYNMTIKTYMTIMAERDAVMRERNIALHERRRAFAERDMAMLQRDAAFAERDNAIEARDKVLAALHFRESSMNQNMSPPDSPRSGAVRGRANHLYHHPEMHSIPQFAEPAYVPREIPKSNLEGPGVACEIVKPRKVKEVKGTITKKSNSLRKGKRGLEQDLGGDSEDLDGHFVMLKDNLGLNQVNFDESTMPVPVCSCTGAPQPCYKWGNGGWQSACCTTTMSMYPLPQMSNKRHARVAGRKMSGGVFAKLLNRLAAEGHDPYAPLDLKDHWAKHGTNRYSTVK